MNVADSSQKSSASMKTIRKKSSTNDCQRNGFILTMEMSPWSTNQMKITLYATIMIRYG